MMNPFERALEVLDEKGWTQGILVNELGHVCAVIALGCAGAPLSAVDLAREVAGQSLVNFNDDPATSEEDVRLLFKHCAAAWEEQS